MPRFMLTWVNLIVLLVTSSSGYVIKTPREKVNDTSLNELRSTHPLLQRQDTADPTDYSWVKNLVAIGDSFTAGIGSGNHLGTPFHKQAEWLCSRYDLSYPMLVNSVIGPSVQKFQFPACSGDRSVQIFDQVATLQNEVNMVIMTAGGNDLCLAGMIKKCVLQPFDGDASCTAIIEKAKENIATILKPNLKQILLALDEKMANDGIVVYNGYARFFNTDNEACATEQAWEFARVKPSHWFKTPLRLTVARREQFNDLVLSINNAIREVIYVLRDEKSIKYTIGFSNWDPWPVDGVAGQMCHPTSTGWYPDPSQPDLQFFKPSTFVWPPGHDELKRREFAEEEYRKMQENGTIPAETDEIDPSIYESLLWKSAAPGAEVLHKLNKRAPSPPGCPGDNDWFDPTLGLGLPDSFGKLFHPNELGHQTIASFALAKGIDLRAKVLGLESETCTVTDEFKCWQKEGRKGYATSDKMNENIQNFCDDVKAPDHEVGWKWEKTYFAGTVDEQTFTMQLSDKVGDFNKELCVESFDRIVNSCDGNDPNNPMNWKFGGRWLRDEYTYEISIKKDNRPWPPIKSTHGKCKGDYKFLWSSYSIQGAGFSSWDSGQNTLIPNIKGCLGLGITHWKFNYFDSPDENGNEWSATFRTPIWVKARCFENNKVVKGAGGFTDGCSGSDA